jgi:hypothetical protein
MTTEDDKAIAARRENKQSKRLVLGTKRGM